MFSPYGMFQLKHSEKKYAICLNCRICLEFAKCCQNFSISARKTWQSVAKFEKDGNFKK